MNCVKYYHVLLTCNLINCVKLIRKALQTLQAAGGAYCLVAAHEGNRKGKLQEGDRLLVLRPEDNEVAPRQAKEEGLDPGYALSITWDVPVGKAMGMVTVNACWHEIVFKNELEYMERNFLY